jgi:hypothetical protein
VTNSQFRYKRMGNMRILNELPRDSNQCSHLDEATDEDMLGSVDHRTRCDRCGRWNVGDSLRSGVPKPIGLKESINHLL